MTKRITIIALLVAFLAAEASAQSHRNRRRGVILGGLAGAAIGAAIGDKGDNETAGALIGGAVGAIAGGTIGNQRDQQLELQRRYHSQYRHPSYGHGSPYSDRHSLPQYYQPQVFAPPPAVHQPSPVVLSPPPPSVLVRDPATNSTVGNVTKQDVLQMVRSGMSDSIIIRQLEIQGMDRALSVSEVIELHQAGVSESVLTAMQMAGPGAPAQPTTAGTSPANGASSTNAPSTIPPRGSSPERLDGPSLLPPPPPRPNAPQFNDR